MPQVSVCSMMGISFSRYVYVCYSHHYDRLFNRSLCALFCLLFWFLAGLVTLPALHPAVDAYYYDRLLHVCFFREASMAVKVEVAVFIFLPVVVVVCLNLLTFHFWRKKQMAVADRYQMLLGVSGYCPTDSQLRTRSNGPSPKPQKWTNVLIRQRPFASESCMSSPVKNVTMEENCIPLIKRVLQKNSVPVAVTQENLKETNNSPKNSASKSYSCIGGQQELETAVSNPGSKIEQVTSLRKTDSPGSIFLPFEELKIESDSDHERNSSHSQETIMSKNSVSETRSKQDRKKDSAFPTTFKAIVRRFVLPIIFMSFKKTSISPITSHLVEKGDHKVNHDHVSSITKSSEEDSVPPPSFRYVEKDSGLPTTSEPVEKDRVSLLMSERVEKDGVSATDRKLNTSTGGMSVHFAESKQIESSASPIVIRSDTIKPKLLLAAIKTKGLKIERMEDRINRLTPFSTSSFKDGSKGETIMCSQSVSATKTINMMPTLTRMYIQTQRQKMRSQKFAVFKSIFLVCVFIIVSLIPYFILSLFRSYYRPTPPAEALIASNMLIFACKATSWVVYGLMNTSIKHGYSRLLVKTFFKRCRVDSLRARR